MRHLLAISDSIKFSKRPISSRNSKKIESKGLPPDSNLSSLPAHLVRQLQDSAIPATARIVSLRRLWKLGCRSTLAFVHNGLHLPAVVLRPTYTGPKNSEAVVLGFAALASMAGITAMFVPTLLWPWGNLVIYPMLTFALFVVCVVALHYRKQHQQRESARGA